LSGFERDLVAQVLEAPDESVLEAIASALVEVLDAEVVIHLATAEQVVDETRLTNRFEYVDDELLRPRPFGGGTPGSRGSIRSILIRIGRYPATSADR
jgi:hypothetical protein